MSKKHPYNRKAFVERRAPAVSAEIQTFEVGALSREQKLLVGLAGAKGWKNFKWSSFHQHTDGSPHIVAQNIDYGAHDDGTFYTIEMGAVKADDPDAELIAAIYLASIGEQL